jgi:hypothetical protein
MPAEHKSFPRMEPKEINRLVINYEVRLQLVQTLVEGSGRLCGRARTQQAQKKDVQDGK